MCYLNVEKKLNFVKFNINIIISELYACKHNVLNLLNTT